MEQTTAEMTADEMQRRLQEMEAERMQAAGRELQVALNAIQGKYNADLRVVQVFANGVQQSISFQFVPAAK